MSGIRRPDLKFRAVDPDSTNLRPALITYEGLPLKSGGAHGLGRRMPSRSWAQLASFLERFTRIQNVDASLSLIHHGWRMKGEVAKVFEETATLFGDSTRKRVGLLNRRSELRWTLQYRRIADAVDWIERAPELPSVDGEPALLVSIETSLQLVSPETGEPFPYQGADPYGHQDLDGYGVLGLGESRMYARLSQQGSSCHITLSLPFEEVTQDVREYARAVADAVPMRLSAHHWRRWQLNKAGTAYDQRKIDIL